MNNELYHYGVKGMKWGVRRYQNKDGMLTPSGKQRYGVRTAKSRNGDVLTISEHKRSGLNKALGKINKRIDRDAKKSTDASISAKGKKVGTLSLYEESSDSLNINWISVKNTERGKGYAQTVLKDVFKYAKVNGYKQLTLEVPGESPDAAHIYEKLGFKYVNDKLTSEDDVWGGLSSMKKEL